MRSLVGVFVGGGIAGEDTTHDIRPRALGGGELNERRFPLPFMTLKTGDERAGRGVRGPPGVPIGGGGPWGASVAMPQLEVPVLLIESLSLCGGCVGAFGCWVRSTSRHMNTASRGTDAA